MGKSFWNKRINCDKCIVVIIIIILAALFVTMSRSADRTRVFDFKDFKWESSGDGQNSVLTFNGFNLETIGPGDIVLGRNNDLFYGSVVGEGGGVTIFIVDVTKKTIELFEETEKGILTLCDRHLDYDKCVTFFALRRFPESMRNLLGN